MDIEEKTDGLMSIVTEGYEVIEKVVKASGSSGRVYLPSEWVGSIVKIIRVTPLKRSEEQNIGVPTKESDN